MNQIAITTESNDRREEKVKVTLRSLLEKYDLSRYAFTDKVHIQNMVIPHSHPTLTLNTRHFDENHILSTYLHEQIHWFLGQNSQQFNEAIRDLRNRYPEVPVGEPEGGTTEHSTYLHLIICPLEYKLINNFISDEQAEQILKEKDVYTWVYEKTIEDYEILIKVVNIHELHLE